MTQPMATPPSDDTRTLFKLLADGEWHLYEEVHAGIAAAVPPGRALRKYENRLELSRKHHRSDREEVALTDAEQIYYGARACAQITISSWKGRGVIQDVRDGVKWIKIKPGFQAWGIGSSNQSPQDVPEDLDTDEGRTEVPQDDSDRSEVAPEGAESVSEPEPVAAEAEPERKPGAVDIYAVAPDEAEPEDKPSNPYDWPPMSPSVTAKGHRECPECGIQVANQARHDEWHEAQNRALGQNEMALFDEVALRTLFKEVMGEQLDGFQRGMQGWMMHQFSQLMLAMTARSGDQQRWTQRGS